MLTEFLSKEQNILGGDNFVGLNRAARWIKSDGGNVVTYVCDLCKKEEIKATAIKTKQDVGEVIFFGIYFSD